MHYILQALPVPLLKIGIGNFIKQIIHSVIASYVIDIFLGHRKNEIHSSSVEVNLIPPRIAGVL